MREVNTRLNKQEYLTLIFDESSNIRRQRIVNLCANIMETGSFYIESVDWKGDAQGAEVIAPWVMEGIVKLLGAKDDNTRIS